MARPSIAIEAHDLKTGWPLFVYSSYVAAEAAGHKRSVILKVINGRNREHHGLGWRLADAVSLLPAWVAAMCVEDQKAEPSQCISVTLAQRLFIGWLSGKKIDVCRFHSLLKARYGFDSISFMSSSWNRGPRRTVIDTVVRGLTLAKRYAKTA